MTRLRIGRPRGDPFPGRNTDLSVLQKVLTGSGAHLPPYSMITGGCFRGLKPLGLKLTTDLQMEQRLRMGGALSLPSPYAFMSRRYDFTVTYVWV